MMSLYLLSLLGFRLCTRLRARVEMRACRAFRKVPYLTATPYGSKGTLSSTKTALEFIYPIRMPALGHHQTESNRNTQNLPC